jgi:hypothetical protein
MPSAKETLDKIAQAIGIATATPEVETVEETVETIETPEAVEVEETAEETVETTEDNADENTDDAKDEAPEATPEVEAVESNDEPEAAAEDKSDDRVKELEAQISELKKILEDSINSETEDAVEAPELPTKEDDGLTHSPEAEVAVKRTKIGDKGGSIMSNVFKYINN